MKRNTPIAFHRSQRPAKEGAVSKLGTDASVRARAAARAWRCFVVMAAFPLTLYAGLLFLPARMPLRQGWFLTGAGLIYALVVFSVVVNSLSKGAWSVRLGTKLGVSAGLMLWATSTLSLVNGLAIQASHGAAGAQGYGVFSGLVLILLLPLVGGWLLLKAAQRAGFFQYTPI